MTTSQKDSLFEYFHLQPSVVSSSFSIDEWSAVQVICLHGAREQNVLKIAYFITFDFSTFHLWETIA